MVTGVMSRIDSMVLQSGELVPLVEINARKSMSLIKPCGRPPSGQNGPARVV